MNSQGVWLDFYPEEDEKFEVGMKIQVTLTVTSVDQESGRVKFDVANENN